MNNVCEFVYFHLVSPGNALISMQFAGRMQKRPGSRPGAPLSKKRGVKMKIGWYQIGFLYKLLAEVIPQPK